MTTELTFFNATGFYYDIESPSSQSMSNQCQLLGWTGAFITLQAFVPQDFQLFLPNLDLGNGNVAGAAVSLAPVVGRVMSTLVNDSSVWQLSTINRLDSPGVQLLANSSPVQTALEAQNITQLLYNVSFANVTFAAKDQYVAGFAFAAPTGSEAPTSLAAGTAGSGALTAGTYYFGVTAVMPWGETSVSNVVSKTVGSNASVPLTWSSVATALSYNVYTGTSSALPTLATNVVSPAATITSTAGSAVAAPTIDTVCLTSPYLNVLPFQN